MLTAKEDAFCLAVIETGNASEAYRRAYDTRNMKPETINRKAKFMMDKDKIRARLVELRAPALKKAEVTIEYIVENLVELVERCMQRAPVMVRKGKRMVQLQDEEGRDVWDFDSRGANAALNTLAKYKGMLTERLKVSGDPDEPIVVRWADHA